MTDRHTRPNLAQTRPLILPLPGRWELPVMTRSGRVQLPDHYEHWPLYGPAGLPSEHPDAQREGEETDGDEGGEPDPVPGREENYGEDHRAE